MLTLYFSPGASSMATHIALNEVGAPFELNYIPLHQHANREAGYLGVNPEGKVPTLMIDGRPLTEVAATLWYLARRYPEAGLLPQYGDIDGEARVISWMSFIASTIHPPGSPHRQRTLARGRRTAPWPQRVGPSIAIRSPISTCSGCSGGLSMRCIPHARPTPAFTRIATT